MSNHRRYIIYHKFTYNVRKHEPFHPFPEMKDLLAVSIHVLMLAVEMSKEFDTCNTMCVLPLIWLVHHVICN